jgi:hypothetical protein
VLGLALVAAGCGGSPAVSNATSVWCYTTDLKPWNKALPGQSVKVRGVVADSSKAPNVEQCEIVEVTGTKPPSIEAQQLAKDIDKPISGQRFDLDNAGHYVIVTGKLSGTFAEQTSAEGEKSYLIEFESKGSKGHVLAQFFKDPRPEIQSRGADKPIRVLGMCEFANKDGSLTLRQCRILDDAP